VVDRLTDTGAGQDLQGDLRFCVAQARSGSADTIVFAVTGVIRVTGAIVLPSVVIEGPGPGLVTLEPDMSNGEILGVTTDAIASVSGLSITGGPPGHIAGTALVRNAGSLTLSNCLVSGAYSVGVQGGGVFNAAGAYLTLERSTIAGNRIFGIVTLGAGIFNEGTLTVISSAIAGNSLQSMDELGEGAGGGIYNSGPAAVAIIRDSTISGNAIGAAGYGAGAGIYNYGTLNVFASTIEGNSVQAYSQQGYAVGGGIYNAGPATLTTVTISTISGNSAVNSRDGNRSAAGGISGPSGTLFIRNSTITANQAGMGGGIWGAPDIRNTIVAGNISEDLVGTPTASGFNLFGTGPAFDETDLVGDPLLGPLQDNGGPTRTHALLPGSPAIGAGDVTDAPEFDQRGPGFPRIVNGLIDIGAYEVSARTEGHFRPSPVMRHVTAGSTSEWRIQSCIIRAPLDGKDIVFSLFPFDRSRT
jgi:hypothetical protein